MGAWLILLPANKQMLKVCITYGLYAAFGFWYSNNTEFALGLIGLDDVGWSDELDLLYHFFIGTPFGFLTSMVIANDHPYLDTKMGRWVAGGRAAVLVSLPVWIMSFMVIPKSLSELSWASLYNFVEFVFLMGVAAVGPVLPIMLLSFFNWRRLGAVFTRS